MRRRSLRSSFVASLRNRFIDLVARWFVPFDQILKTGSTVDQFADCNKSRLSSLFFFMGAEPLGVAMARKCVSALFRFLKMRLRFPSCVGSAGGTVVRCQSEELYCARSVLERVEVDGRFALDR